MQIVDSAYLCDTSFYISISAPGFPLQALASSDVAVCYGGISGEVLGSSAGGTPGYIYSWYESGNPVSFSNNDTAVGLSAGSYFLFVEDANGCDTFTSVNVIEPQFPLDGSVQIFGVPCKGDDTGMIVGDAGGGWGPYSYYWLGDQNDTLQFSSISVFGRDTLFDLLSGIYQLHIYDAKGCFAEYTLNVPEPDDFLSIDVVLVDGIACYGDSVGKAILYASGGQVTYAYLWDNGETTTVADNLTSGWHSVVLSDDWGCEVKDSINIPENALIVSTLLSDTSVSCYGVSDGIASIYSEGGSSDPFFTYFWSQGQQTVDVNTDNIDSLSYGSYYVTTRDALGCEVVDTFYISEPDPLSMEASELDWIDCYNTATGEAFATATGGAGDYVFTWDESSTGTPTWQGDTVYTLTKGVHIVIVTDARGCTASDTVVTHSPDSLYINIVDSLTILPYCVGVNTASLSATASGGTLGYTYEWDDNLILPQTTATASALLAGTYTITVTDSKGCEAEDTRDIDINTDTNALLSIQLVSLYQYASTSSASNDVSCFGYNDGGAVVTASGGYTPYAYEWTGGSSAITATIDNLYAGTYSVIVRDINNCMVNGSIFLTEPLVLTFNTSVNISESCLGACDGVIFIDSLSGGVTPYSALLTNNITAAIDPYIVSNDSVLGVCSGDYTVVLTDVNDCPSSVIAGGVNQQLVGYNTITVAAISVADTICHASSTGVLDVLGPISSYSYSWENANGDSISSGLQVDNLSAGVYVLLADYNNTPGCTSTDTIQIIEYLAITNAVTIDHVDCYGDSDGKITTLASSGGTSPYTYSWNTTPIQTTPQATGLSAGVYVCTITDINSCENLFPYNVTEPQVLTVNITTNSSYVLSAAPSGGIAPFSYSWREQSNPNASIGTSMTYTVANYGIYYVVVTDGNGCTSESNSFTSEAPLSIDESLIISLSIYPNPFKDETTVDFGKEIDAASIRVVDVFGKLIGDYRVTNTDKYILKRENKASGIYFMEIEVEHGDKTIYKLIIE